MRTNFICPDKLKKSWLTKIVKYGSWFKIKIYCEIDKISDLQNGNISHTFHHLNTTINTRSWNWNNVPHC